MACERYQGTLTDVAAGKATPPNVAVHVASCETCRAELLVLRRALAVADAELTGLASAQPSPGLAACIREAVITREAGDSALDRGPSLARRLGWLWPAVAAAATLLVALAVSGFRRLA